MKETCVVGVDLGATNIRVALILKRGKILKRAREQTSNQGKSGVVVTNQIIKLISNITKGEGQKSIAGIGISSMGPLDHKKGGPQDAPNIAFSFIPLVKPLEQNFSLPVFLLKDTHAGVLAEKYFGEGKHAKNLVYITISTGIGGGAIVDNHLILGKSRNAAEIGHLLVDTKYSIPCTCRKGYGHWEGIASGRNIPRFFTIWKNKENKKTNFKAKEAKDIFDAAKQHNKTAIAFLDELSKINARAISDIIVAYDPELITIGGSVAFNNPQFTLKGIKNYVDHYLKIPRIEITKLGDDIGLLGAAAAVFKKKEGSQ